VCIGGEDIVHMMQSIIYIYIYKEFHVLNWIQLSYDFGKVVPSVSTQGCFCPGWNFVKNMDCAKKTFLHQNINYILKFP